MSTGWKREEGEGGEEAICGIACSLGSKRRPQTSTPSHSIAFQSPQTIKPHTNKMPLLISPSLLNIAIALAIGYAPITLAFIYVCLNNALFLLLLFSTVIALLILAYRLFKALALPILYLLIGLYFFHLAFKRLLYLRAIQWFFGMGRVELCTLCPYINGA